MPVIDYEAWSRTYDDTRAASPSVLGPIQNALGPPGGRSLLDIGGGTGNFAAPLAASGFRIALIDPTQGMVLRAAAKLPDAIGLALADAHHLPFADATFDCALSVNVLGHLADWRASLTEARRVISGGPFVIKASTRETLKANWVLEYMPQMLDHAPLHHYQPEQTTLDALSAAGFTRIDLTRLHYRDAVDGSFQALKHFPESFLSDDAVMNTATFQRVPPEQLRAGIEAIRRDLRSGRLAEVITKYKPLVAEYGDGTVFAAYP
jgi:ubiquinone/menaquinone biosynthesis C-methylase UbiE